MRIETFGLALAAVAVIPATSADAAVVAKWTMATAIPSATTGSNFTYGAADQGENAAGSSLSGYHAQSGAAWTTPAGNGSTYSLSSDKWSQGDYYQIVVQTTGYENFQISWDQTRSSTGPSDFRMSYSTDGGATFTTAMNYSVIQAGAIGSGTNTWSATGAVQTAFANASGILSTPSGTSSLIVRFVATGLNLGAGTNRIDNITVNGTAIVPAPGAIALLAAAGLTGMRRRR
jgi:hypothetical protein